MQFKARWLQMDIFVGTENNTDIQFLTEKKGIARMSWEKSYLEILVDHLRPSGEVLEVGFALGYSAARIQTYRPTHHTIIEPDPEIAAKAVKWAETHPSICIIQDTWENALPKLGIFDAVFFNDLKPDLEAQKTQYCEMGNSIVQKGGELVASVRKRLPQMMNMRYSDADMDEFFNQVSPFQAHEMANFLHELRRNGQISKAQCETLISKYRLEKKEAHTLPKIIDKQPDCLLAFLKICLKNHMRKGSRFSCFASTPLSKFESPEFFESIITSPDLDYQEKLIPLDVPKSCEYYKYNEGLVMIIEKQI